MAGLDADELTETGCTLAVAACNVLAIAELRALCDDDTGPGQRLSLDAALARPAIAMITEVVAGVARELRPVRALLFNKSAARNWSVPWHQDRTIAVDRRIEIPGYGPWSTKSGVAHVEPPFTILAAMITVRLHLDDCPADNAPLVVALGSHRARVTAHAAAAQARALPQRICTAQAGDLWLYSTPILHRSDRARSPGVRRVVQIDYTAASLPTILNWAG